MQVPFDGLHGINHLSTDDLHQSIKSTPVHLKKGAVPTIFNSTNVIQSIEPTDPTHFFHFSNSTTSKSHDVLDVKEVANIACNVENMVPAITEKSGSRECHSRHSMCEDEQDAQDGCPIKCINKDPESMRIECANLEKEHFLQRFVC